MAKRSSKESEKEEESGDRRAEEKEGERERERKGESPVRRVAIGGGHIALGAFHDRILDSSRG